jgi:MinD-like ATPase involved in chromosome partitioning or flagellar assembly
MPFDTNASLPRAQIAAYVCTDQGAAIAKDVMQRNGGEMVVSGGGLSGAGRMSDSLPAADIILTEIGNIPVDMACECVTEIRNTGADVIVLGEQTDIDTYRALRKAGALEYFTFPVSAEDILAVERVAHVQPVSNVIEMPQAPVLNPAIAVLGSNGGVGASLLAQNLAFYASSTKGPNKRTALLDADIQFGSQAIDLDRDETAGLFEALKAPDRIDTTFLNATMDHLNDRFSLYSHQVRIGQDVQSFEAGLSGLMSPLRTEFDALVVDLPRHALLEQAELAAQLDVVILVIPAGFAGVNAATRLIERITAQNADVRILPVLSELRHDAGLSRKDVATTIGRPIIATLPNSDKAMMRAHRAARPLIESQPRGAYASSVRTLWAAAIAEQSVKGKTPRKPLMKRMFG